MPHKTKEEYYEYYKNIIESYGGTIISDQYITAKTNIEVQCKNGHLVKKRPYRFIDGIKCNKCEDYYKNNKGNKKMSNQQYYEFYKNIIESKGGKMVSKEYVNARTEL